MTLIFIAMSWAGKFSLIPFGPIMLLIVARRLPVYQNVGLIDYIFN